MIPQIRLKDIENELFTIKKANTPTIDINYIDFAYKIPAVKPYPAPVIFKKLIQLNPFIFYKSIIANDIIKELQKEFIIKITELGKKHRENSELTSKLDIIIKNIKKSNTNISRAIMSKFISNGNNIAVQGRIGPGQFIISNISTYNYILSYLGDIEIVYDDKYRLKIATLTYIVDDSVEDDIILIGRKNNIDMPGMHCLIETDENDFIKFEEYHYAPAFLEKPEYALKMHYSIFDVGSCPEYQYYAISIRDISYYRNKKLLKIKKIYG